MKQLIHTYLLVVGILALVVVRLAMGCAMPLAVHSGYEDTWAVHAADSISQGFWLGTDASSVAIHAPGFPIFLALCRIVGVDYLFAASVLYILAALLFMMAVRPLFKRRLLFFVVFAGMLFCPVGFSTDTFQRVCRNSIAAAQVLIVCGSFIGMLLRAKGMRSIDALRASERALWRKVEAPWQCFLPWSITAAFGLSWFATTYEDASWLVPFTLLTVIAGTVAFARRFRLGQMGARALAACLALTLLPFACAALSVTAVAAVNDAHYGVFALSQGEGASSEDGPQSGAAVTLAELAPWCTEHPDKVLPVFCDALLDAVDYAGVSCDPYDAQGMPSEVTYFERVTGSLSYSSGDFVPWGCGFGSALVGVYRVVAPVVFFLGLASLLLLFCVWLWRRLHHRGSAWVGPLVFSASCLLLAACALLACQGCARASSSASAVCYLAAPAAYPLLLVVGGLALAAVVELASSLRKSRKMLPPVDVFLLEAPAAVDGAGRADDGEGAPQGLEGEGR